MIGIGGISTELWPSTEESVRILIKAYQQIWKLTKWSTGCNRRKSTKGDLTWRTNYFTISLISHAKNYT